MCKLIIRQKYTNNRQNTHLLENLTHFSSFLFLKDKNAKL